MFQQYGRRLCASPSADGHTWRVNGVTHIVLVLRAHVNNRTNRARQYVSQRNILWETAGTLDQSLRQIKQTYRFRSVANLSRQMSWSILSLANYHLRYRTEDEKTGLLPDRNTRQNRTSWLQYSVVLSRPACPPGAGGSARHINQSGSSTKPLSTGYR